jgi:aminopeptidase N
MEYVGVATVDDYFKGVYSRGDLRRSRYGPVAQPKDANSFGDLFNPNVYSGGALVLYALRQQVGTDAFRQIEQAWAARYRGRSASTRDFINLASEVAGRDLHAFLTAWLYSTTTPPMPGHPDWTVTPGA